MAKKKFTYSIGDKNVTKSEYEAHIKANYPKSKKRGKPADQVSDYIDIPGADEYKPVRATFADYMKYGMDGIRDRARPTLAAVIVKALAQVTKGKKDPALVKIIMAHIKKAEAGNLKSAEFLFNRAFGMPKQTVENSGEMLTRLQIEIITPPNGTVKP